MIIHIIHTERIHNIIIIGIFILFVFFFVFRLCFACRFNIIFKILLWYDVNTILYLKRCNNTYRHSHIFRLTAFSGMKIIQVWYANSLCMDIDASDDYYDDNNYRHWIVQMWYLAANYIRLIAYVNMIKFLNRFKTPKQLLNCIYLMDSKWKWLIRKKNNRRKRIKNIHFKGVYTKHI